MATREIGVGLVSVGWMGRLHSRAYSAVPLFYPELGIRPRLVVAADTAASGREYATDVLGYERAVADYRDVIADPEVDVVSICAPNFLHAEVGIAAARAGKPFWIEKPVGRGGDETAAVAAAVAESSGEGRALVTCVGFNYRHVPAVQYAKQLIAEGRLGRITNVRGRFFGGFSSDPTDPLAWRFVRETSGSGVLGDLMGHLVDLVHYLVGPISAVSASTGTYITERAALDGSGMKPVENDDYAALLVRFHDEALAGGAIGVLDASRIAVGATNDYGIEINGTGGSLRWDFLHLGELEVALGHGPLPGVTRLMANKTFPDFARFQPGAGTPMGYDDLKIIEAAKFLTAVTGGDPTSSNIVDAVASARVLDAAEQSVQSGCWVDTPLQQGSTAAVRAAVSA